MARILRRNVRLIATVFAVCLAIAALYLIVAPKRYTATVSILFDAFSRPPLISDPAYAPVGAPDPGQVESQVKLIASDSVLRRAVIDERLQDDAGFAGSSMGILGRLFGRSPASAGSATERAVRALANEIEVKRSERTYVIDVDVTTGDPALSARLANAVARAYFADQQAARRDIADRDAAYLHSHLEGLQNGVRDAEDKVTGFKIANGITDANGKNLAEQELSDLASQLGQARGQTLAAEARADQIQRLAAQGRALDATSDALKSVTLDRLRAQYADLMRQQADARLTYGARHPALQALAAQAQDVRRLIDQELRRIAASSRSDAQIARANERAIAQRLVAARKANDDKNAALLRMRDLQRDADTARATYDQFMRAEQMVGAGSAAPAPSARVIAAAIPPLAPSSPKVLMTLAIAAFLGLFFGAGLSFLRESMSPAAVLPSHAGALGEPILAARIPRIRPRSQGGHLDRAKAWFLRTREQEREQDAIVSDWFLDEVEKRPTSPFSAAIERLWDVLGAKRGGARRPWTILVGSLSSSVGKTTIAVNLARQAAKAGQRVLLLEANGDNPQLWRMIDEATNPGLIDVSGVDRVIYPCAVSGAGSLDFVPIMASEQRTARRLRARAGVRRFEGIADSFDVVVIDGPSSRRIEDLRELAGTADALAFVVRQNERARAEKELEDLQLASDQLDAGVLTIVEDHREAA